MTELPSRDDLLRRKVLAADERDRSHERAVAEKLGLEAACARYWELLEEFVARARELGLEPRMHESKSRRGLTPRVIWVEGYRLTGGSIVSAPPLRYRLAERRLVVRPRQQTYELEEVSLFVASTELGREGALGEPKTASRGDWPPVYRWDRTANVLNALESQLEATLLALMDE